MNDRHASMEAALQASMTRPTVARAIDAWIARQPSRTAGAELAKKLGMTRQYIWNISAGKVSLPDKYIPLLPDGLRQEVAELRAQEYETQARSVRVTAGVNSKNLRTQAAE